jgi:hypothetical protein
MSSHEETGDGNESTGTITVYENTGRQVMNSIEVFKVPRRKTLVRLLYTILYLIIFEILKIIVQVTVLFQFAVLLITQRHSEPLKNFSNKVATYAYKIIRYVTLNENLRPFPFHDFPAEHEAPEEPVRFD